MARVGAFLGFFALGREQQNGPALGAWAAFCHALGISADTARERAATAGAHTDARQLEHVVEALDEPGRMRAIRQSGRQTVAERYALDRCLPAQLALIEEVLS